MIKARLEKKEKYEEKWKRCKMTPPMMLQAERGSASSSSGNRQQPNPQLT
jgi:hypothetical protein